MTQTRKKTISKSRLLYSAIAFILCYIAIMLCTVAMIVINTPETWTEYFALNFQKFLSLCICVLLLCGVIYYYYYFEDRELLVDLNGVFMIFTVMIVSLIVNYLFGRYLRIYSRPVAMFPMIMLFLLNRRQAIMLNFVFSLLIFVIDTYTNNFTAAGIADSEIYYYLILRVVIGTISVFGASSVKTRGGLLLMGIILALPTAVIVLLMEVPDGVFVSWIDILYSIAYRVLGSVVSAVAALALLPLYEVLFNRLTVFRLRELTSANAPLLQRLRTEAPGTFNHSLIVAQLAETCAIAIGENAELARAAAYYHDVGKLKQPDCFTENQTDYNMHDELTPELSADIIRSHARDGYELLNKTRLPKEIADIAREHHGTLPIKYFYDKANRLSGGDAHIQDYSYGGPTPRTKIAAIIMIADAAEAAARTLSDRSPENVERIIRAIIEERMDLDQFTDCNITMRELSVIKQTLVDALTGVHHHRVKYPSIRFNRERKIVSEDENERD